MKCQTNLLLTSKSQFKNYSLYCLQELIHVLDNLGKYITISGYWRYSCQGPLTHDVADRCWPPYFYHKDTYRIKFSRFYLLWGVRYQHLYEFSHFQKCDNYIITPSNVWKNFQDMNLSEPGQKYPYMPKISPGGLPVSSIYYISHIHIL